MSNSAVDVLGLAERRLAWVDRRQGVLAQNIANANTPGYAARDIRPFRDVLASEAQRQSGAVSGVVSADAASVRDRSTSERSPDGNAVALDEQLMKVAETDTAHQLAMNLYRKYTGLFKTALGRG